jgi:hypothetical protein
MRPPSKCPSCGLDLGPYAETHCPQCGVSLGPKPPVSGGIRLLDLTIAVGGTLFVLGSLFGFVFYMNSSTRAQLYEGAPYHATTFRVTSVQYARLVSMGNKSNSSSTTAYAIGIAEGQKESMDLMTYLARSPRDQYDLMNLVPEGTVIPVYLFPTLKGASRIQPIRAVPTAEGYQRQAGWASNRALPVVGAIGILTALLGLGRFSLSRDRTVAN